MEKIHWLIQLCTQFGLVRFSGYNWSDKMIDFSSNTGQCFWMNNCDGLNDRKRLLHCLRIHTNKCCICNIPTARAYFRKSYSENWFLNFTNWIFSYVMAQIQKYWTLN